MLKRIVYLIVILIGFQFEAYSQPLNKKIPLAEEDTLFSFQNLVYVEFALIVFLLIYVLINKASVRKKMGMISADLDRIRKERDQLKFEKGDLKRELSNMQALREEDHSQLNLLKEEQATVVTLEAHEPEEQSNTIIWDKPEAPQKLQETFYSRYADLADGFSASELLNEEGNDTIFEITILSPNKASFRVSTNPAAQKYALSNADYFLEPTCRYDTLPAGTIITQKPGLLSLVGGKWEIKEQASISFK